MTLRRAPEEGHAYFACTACARLKRKCSRDLPSCTLCLKVGRPCEYVHLAAGSPGTTPSSNSSATIVRARPHHRRGSSHTAPSTPVSFAKAVRSIQGPSLSKYFIDSVVTRGTAVPRPEYLRWRDISSYPAPSAHDVHLILGRYFASTHHWLPIVSKKRLSRHVQNGSELSSADAVALLLVMNLLSQHLAPEHATQQYHAVRAALTACGSVNMLTTNLLAASVLLAAYETVQGIYPSAYLSVSHCARLFYALGLHDKKKATPLIHDVDTWTELEERRRLWWAVILLDRYIHAGFRFRPLCVEKVPPGEILPAHDDKWDEGELTVNALLVMSIEAKTDVSGFARTCQAAHILGKVCEHLNEHASAEDVDMHLEEAAQIIRAIKALRVMVEQEILSSKKPQCLFTAKTLCLSALSLMYDTHGCIEGGQLDTSGVNRGLRLELQQQSIDGCKEVSIAIADWANELGRSSQPETVSPFVLHGMYSAAGTWAWLYRESGDAKSMEALEQLRYVLGLFGERWNVGKEYLALLEGQEQTKFGASYQ